MSQMTGLKSQGNEAADAGKTNVVKNKASRIKGFFEKKGRLICVIVSCVILAFILFLVSRIELISDDWHFKFVFTSYMPGEHETRINGPDDIFVSMKNFYNTSGGRVLAHSILQVILMADKAVFNILNAAIFLAVGILIWVLAKKDDEKCSPLYILGFLAMFVLLPSFGDSCLWVSGAVNYLWMSVIYLAFFLCVKKEKPAGMCILALLSGFTNEPVGGMIIVFLATRWIVEHRKPKGSEIISCVLVLIGMFFILVAPGNRIRATRVSQTEIFSVKTAIECFGKTVAWIFSDLAYIPIVISIAVMVAFRKNIKTFCNEIAFMIAAFAGMGALTLSGTFLPRAQFPCVVCLIVCFIGCVSKGYAFYKALDDENKLCRFFRKELMVFSGKVLKIAVVGLVIVSLVLNLVVFFSISSKETKQMDSIRKAAETGETVHVTLNEYANTGTFFPNEVSVSNEYEALWQAEYYGIDIEWE